MTANHEIPTSSSTLVSPLIPPYVYSTMSVEDLNSLPESTIRLDVPTHRPVIHWDAEDTWVVGGRAGSTLVCLSAVAKEQLPGPPMRGIYRMSETRACTTSDGVDMIHHCIAQVAANGGRTVWCLAPLDAVGVWQQCGFALAGEPLRARERQVAVVMMRAIVPSDAGLTEPLSRRSEGAQL